MSRRPRRNRQRAHGDKSDRSTSEGGDERFDDQGWIWVDGRRMFVVDYTPGGAPFGVYEDEHDSEQVVRDTAPFD